MNLIRKYKISKILNKPLEGVEQEIILFIHSWLSDLIPFKYTDSESFFYMNTSGLYVLELDNQNGYLYVRWSEFWSVLENKYFISYQDTQLLLKFMIEESFKKHLAISFLIKAYMFVEIEEAFNTTPTPTKINSIV